MTNAVSLAQQASTGVSPSFRNRIINGNMVISQRNGTTAVNNSNNTYCLDRWVMETGLDNKFSAGQYTNAPTGFSNSLGISSNSAYSVPAGEYYGVAQKIEGFNTADLGWGTASAKTVTLSFWVYSSLTGTFAGSILNSALNRSYVFSYSVSSANTWTQASVTIPGDTSGTWIGATNGIGLEVFFSVGTGSGYSTAAGTWNGLGYRSATGAVSVVGTSGATFYITGVQLEVGSTATSFDYRPYGTELALCQRYYWRNQSLTNNYNCFTTGTMYGASEYFGYVAFPVSMRSTPSFGISNLSDFGLITTSGGTLTAFTLEGASPISGRLGATPSSSRTAGHGAFIQANNTSAAWIAFSAEL